MYEKWCETQDRVNKFKKLLTNRYPNMYLLICVYTGRFAIGNPLYDSHGGYLHASQVFDCKYGSMKNTKELSRGIFGVLLSDKILEDTNVKVEKCDFLQDRFEIAGGHWCECLRSDDHEGPHLILKENGTYVIWIDDMCENWRDCEGCSSEDTTDWCIAYGTVSPEEAQIYLDDAKYKG